MTRRISVEIVGNSASLERSFNRSSSAARGFERDIGSSGRGVAAATIAFRGLGRSLAFASASFVSAAAVTSVIRNSVEAAENLKKAQEGLAVAIEHTGGNLADLAPKYAAIARDAQRFGVSQVDATTALERATVLTGSARSALRAYQEALVISKATGKDFNTVLTATAKGQEGVTTSLQRYGILIAKGTGGQQQFLQVMSRFGGQARANTSEMDRFRATLANTEAIVGTALLPTLDKLLSKFADWLDTMNRSGRLQHQVNTAVNDGVTAFRGIADIVKVTDRATGSFLHTLELIVGLRFARYLAGLAAGWDTVGVAATRAAAAQTGAVAAQRGGFLGSITRPGVESAFGPVEGASLETAQFRMRTAPFSFGLSSATGGMAALAGLNATSGAAAAARTNVTALRSSLTSLSGLTVAAIGIPIVLNVESKLSDTAKKLFGTSQAGSIARDLITPHSLKDFAGISLFNDIFNFRSPASRLAQQIAAAVQAQITKNLSSGRFTPSFLPTPRGFGSPGSSANALGPFGAAQPISVFKSFSLTIPEQLAQARAAITKSTTDDVAAAKELVARIKRLIDEGHLSGKSLIQALQSESSALSTIWSAESAAAQKRAADAQAAKQRIEQQITNAIDPLKLEVALSRAEAFGKPVLPRLRALLAAAERGLAKAMAAHNLALEKQALDQIASLKQQIQSAQTSTSVTFTAPARLQLALAKDAALGLDPTKDLLKLKAAILKFIATHKKNIQALTDAYNQLQSVNQQLGQTAQTALGLFKQASTRALTAGLGLTAAQRKALRARLSQLGPGGTVPGQGTGAFGFVIGDNGRAQTTTVNVNVDGKKMASVTARHRHRKQQRNPTQRRGPNAATSTA